MEVPIEASPEVCGACGKTVRSEAAVATPEGGWLCPLCFTKADIIATRRRAGFEGSAVALVGAIATVIPFVARMAALRIAGASGHDRIVLACGIVAAVSGGATIVAARARASGGWLMIGALGLALGAYHVARGAGLVG